MEDSLHSIGSNISFIWGGGPKRTKHGDRPIFSMDFGKIVYIFAEFGNKNTGGHGNFYFDRYLTDMSK